MAVPEVLHRLLTAAGPSGFEQAPAAVFREACSAFAEPVADVLGSTVARVPGRGTGPSVAFIGHIDEIGLIVSHVGDDGFLWFLPVGGWDPVILVGQRVEVITRDGAIPGVVGKKPIHLLKDEERKKFPEMKELHIDIGAEDGDEARALVAVGDVAVISSHPVELPNGRVVSRSLDNRLGCYVALEAARHVRDAGGAMGDVFAVAAAQEETTFAGARTTAYSLRPDVAIIVDVTHATDVPGVEEKELGSHALGSGAVIGRGSTLDPIVAERLHAAALDREIPFTIEAFGGRTGTDADAVHLSRGGVPCGVVSIPLRYMHSPVEMVQLSDVDACARLMAAFALGLDADVSFVR